jgi:beta-N-acetylhexosaminidase
VAAGQTGFMAPRAFICGISGLALTEPERRFIQDAQPWGVILFARNIEAPAQVRALCADLRATAGRNDLAILIDQEGGRVQRLRPPLWPRYPSGEAIGTLYKRDEGQGLRSVWLAGRLIGEDLAQLGIDVDCLPVADLRFPQTHSVIGDRAYGDTPQAVAALARAASQGLMAAGVSPVVKHIPGHGRATVDSHLALPTVHARRHELEATDFAAFRALADLPMAMTAHIVFTALDPALPATQSPIVVSEIIRGTIGFDGFLMTDDLSMHALSGDFSERTERCFEAGCDIVLHCNGDMAEMQAVAAASPELNGDALRRAMAARPAKADEDAALDAWRSELAALLGLDAAQLTPGHAEAAE